MSTVDLGYSEGRMTLQRESLGSTSVCLAETRAEKLMEGNQEFTGFGSIWDWLVENGGPKRPTAPPAPSPEEIEPTHRISDDELLALEREAEIAAKMTSEAKSGSSPVSRGLDV